MSMLVRSLQPGVELRMFEADDAAELYAVIDANRSELARWMPWAATQTLEETRAYIRRTRDEIAAEQAFQTAIVVDGAIAGAIGALGIDRRDLSMDIGYWLASSAQGRGIMTTAVRAYTEQAFDGWALHRVQLECAVDNVRSRAIPERLGFAQEGVRCEAERVGDRWHDLVVYAAVTGRWPNRPSGAGR